MEAASTGAAADGILSSAANDVEQSQNQFSDETARKRYRIKVDGHEMDVDEDELKKGYQLSKAAHKRMQEAAAERKRLEPFAQLLSNVRDNPKQAFDLLEQLGVSKQQIRDLVFGQAGELMEYEMLSPEQREAMELKREVERYKKAEAEAKRAEELRAQNEQFNQACIAIENDFCDFVEALPEKPDAYTLAKIADYRLKSYELDTGPWSWKQAYDRVQRDVAKYEEAVRNKLTADKIPDKLKLEMRKADVQKVRKNAPTYRKASDTPSRSSKPKPQRTEDYFKQLEDRYK